MGIIPVETVPGDNCALCFDPGKTPAQVKLFISGIRRSPHWNPFWGTAPNQYFDLFQDEHNPCGWTSEVGPKPRATFHMIADDSIIQVWSDNDQAAFVSHAGAPCIYHGSNEFVGQFPLGFQGGWGYVSTPKIIAGIIVGWTAMIDPDPRMELFPMADGLIVIRYAGKRDATNFSFKFDTNA